MTLLQHYRYRWWYAVSLCGAMLLSVALFLFHPMHMQLKHLRQWENQLRQQSHRLSVTSSRRLMKPVQQPVQQQAMISALILSVHRQGIAVPFMRFSPSHDGWHMELTLEGRASSLLSWMLMVTQPPCPIGVITTSYRVIDPHTLQIKLTAWVPDTRRALSCFAVPEKTLSLLSTLFCPIENRLLTDQQRQAALQSTPVDHLRLLGYVQQGTERQAFVMLPNGLTMAYRVSEK